MERVGSCRVRAHGYGDGVKGLVNSLSTYFIEEIYPPIIIALKNGLGKMPRKNAAKNRVIFHA